MASAARVRSLLKIPSSTAVTGNGADNDPKCLSMDALTDRSTFFANPPNRVSSISPKRRRLRTSFLRDSSSITAPPSFSALPPTSLVVPLLYTAPFVVADGAAVLGTVMFLFGDSKRRDARK